MSLSVLFFTLVVNFSLASFTDRSMSFKHVIPVHIFTYFSACNLFAFQDVQKTIGEYSYVLNMQGSIFTYDNKPISIYKEMKI